MFDMNGAPALFWFRQDLRFRTIPPWRPLSSGAVPYSVFIWSPEEEGSWRLGAASEWWLGRSLTALNAEWKSAVRG